MLGVSPVHRGLAEIDDCGALGYGEGMAGNPAGVEEGSDRVLRVVPAKATMTRWGSFCTAAAAMPR